MRHPRRSPVRCRIPSAWLGLSLFVGVALVSCAPRPELVEDRPSSLAQFSVNPVRFAWHGAAPGGEEFVDYRLQVARTVRFDEPVHDQYHPRPEAEVILPPGSYYWRVQGRFRRIDGTLERTDWSDLKQVDGQPRQQARSLTVTAEPAAAAPAEAAPALAQAQAAPRAARPVAASRSVAESVVPAHTTRPGLEGVDTLGVAPIVVDGQEDPVLTRELVLRLFEIGRYTLLEQQLQPAGELRLPTEAGDAARGKEAPAERTQAYQLHRGQPTPMFPDRAVRLQTPDAMLVVRIGRLAFDPSLLPRRPAPPSTPRPDFGRFESGTRVLNATLVSVDTGIIRWTTSLYGLPDIADMALVSNLVETYFR